MGNSVKVGGQTRLSFAGKIEAADGRTSGFDLMRIVLAIGVIGFHSIVVCYGISANMEAWSGPYRGLASALLPMFFALSGFLVAGSLERSATIHGFLTLRAIRIVPALFVETVLCALILGTAFTTWDLKDYFAAGDFRSYFLNIIGVVQYKLPGVFRDIPADAIVNVSLWTVPYELECYLALGALSLLGIARSRWTLLVLVGGACILAPLWLEVPTEFLRPTGHLLVLSFMFGILAYKFRDVLPHRGSLAIASLAIAVVCFSWPVTAYWGAPFIAYTTVYLGLLRAPKIPVLMNGDYSYGLYLFAFPLQQVQATLFPEARIWFVNAAFAIGFGFLYAAFSWHFVEKPVLERRRLVLRFVEGRIEFLAGIAARAWRMASGRNVQSPTGVSGPYPSVLSSPLNYRAVDIKETTRDLTSVD